MIFLIAISLSMDAFSLSLAYGTNKIENKTKYVYVDDGIDEYV